MGAYVVGSRFTQMYLAPNGFAMGKLFCVWVGPWKRTPFAFCSTACKYQQHDVAVGLDWVAGCPFSNRPM